MNRTIFILFFLIATVSTIFVSPILAKEDCDLENTPISLKLINKPMREILKSIEKQTELTFDVRDDKTLGDKKSIILDQVPLDQSIRRLLKNTNYSIICNNEQKVLTVVFLDSQSLPSPLYARTETGEPQSMEGIDTAFAEYTEKAGQPADQEEPRDDEVSFMDGATRAFEEYTDKAGQPAQEELQNQEVSSMDGATTAFQEYTNKAGQPDQEANAQEVSSMDGATAAFQEYTNKAGQPAQEPNGPEVSSMDGATAAFSEYYGTN